MKRILLASLLMGLPLFGSIHLIPEPSKLSNNTQDLYIDLLKRAVLNTIYDDIPHRQEGTDWPKTAHTMVGSKRLNNVEMCVKDILANNVPGDFVETGVWRGGTTIFMRGLLKAFNDNQRIVWVCDSFAGLPPPDAEKYPADKGLNLHVYPELAISLETVQSNFSKYGLLDNQVRFVKGFFRDTLPTAPIKEISLLRLDGDLYESTMDALVNLYPKLSVGGYLIIDDMCIPACVQAVHDYRNKNGITTPLETIDWTGVYWKKQ